MPELNISAEDRRVKKIERPTLMGGKETRYRTVLTAISATSCPGLTMSGLTVDFQDLIYDCAIGFPMWDQRTITLDIPRSRLIVEE